MLEAPEVEGHLHHKTGHGAADKILAVLAVFLSGVSVFIAVHHGKTMERLVAANSWPNISYGTSNLDDATGRDVISLTLKNTGVGPARIDSFEVFYKGKPLKSVGDLADCCGKGRFSSTTSNVLDEVLPARESINFIAIAKSATTPEIWEAANRERFNIRVRVCYCSVFDECFVRDSAERRPHRVSECRPSQPVEYR